MLNIGRGRLVPLYNDRGRRPREHPKGHVRADIAHLPAAHAHTPYTPPSGDLVHAQGNPKGSGDLRSLPVAMVLVLLCYYSSKKKHGTKPGMCRTYFRSLSLPVPFT